MPSKYICRFNQEKATYHVTNRGVNKCPIFLSPRDYKVYVRYLGEYLSPKEVTIKNMMSLNLRSDVLLRRLKTLAELKNYSQAIELYDFGLMPNHIHFEIYQEKIRDISAFMQSINTRYSRYFNKRYTRIGTLYQSRFKARYLSNDADLLRVSRYIHRNAIDLGVNIRTYEWSSYQYYVSGNPPIWLKRKRILDAFKNSTFSFKYSKYTDFVEAEPLGSQTSGKPDLTQTPGR